MFDTMGIDVKSELAISVIRLNSIELKFKICNIGITRFELGDAQPACCVHDEPLGQRSARTSLHFACPLQSMRPQLVRRLGWFCSLPGKHFPDELSSGLLSFFQVGSELTNVIDMDRSDYEAPFGLPASCHLLPSQPTYRHAVINNTLVQVQKLNEHARFFIIAICLGKGNRVAWNLNVRTFGIQTIFFSWKWHRTSFNQ